MACKRLTAGLQQMALETCNNGAAKARWGDAGGGTGDDGRELRKRPVAAPVGHRSRGSTKGGHGSGARVHSVIGAAQNEEIEEEARRSRHGRSVTDRIWVEGEAMDRDRKSTRLNSSHAD